MPVRFRIIKTTMPKFLEKKLKKSYGKGSKVPHKIMNSIGAMRGSKETKKGKDMQKKHDEKTSGGDYLLA